ncbi:MAG: hypothetical protein GY729_03870 [Desulfobacteraceae bacterium]|nr:hypothetical protein [Desulfobacteraceae bacterium]
MANRRNKVLISLFNIDTTDYDIAAQNNLEHVRSDLKTTQLNIQRCIIIAPFTGRIKQESADKGTGLLKFQGEPFWCLELNSVVLT